MPKTTSAKPARRDIYAEVTAAIVEAAESHPGAPQMPWRTTGRPLWLPENAVTHETYRGINIVSLWVAAHRRAFSTNLWATYLQWQEIGAQVKKNARSHPIVRYTEFDVDPDPNDPDDNGKRRSMRHFNVFNADDVDGFELPPPPEPLDPITRINAAERFITATGAKVEQGGERAFYRISEDRIQMPDERLFTGTDTMNRDESWYAVLLHELTHWCGHETRCNRPLSGKFGSPEYAREELVAEIGSAFLCARLQITQDTRPDHAQYVANWLQLLKSEPKAIFKAAAAANEAVTFLEALQKPSLKTAA